MLYATHEYRGSSALLDFCVLPRRSLVCWHPRPLDGWVLSVRVPRFLPTPDFRLDVVIFFRLLQLGRGVAAVLAAVIILHRMPVLQ